jgi:hypothetical protein
LLGDHLGKYIKKVEGVGVMKDKELKLVEVNSSRTLVQRGRSCTGRGKWRGCRCYLLTDTRSRRISLAGKSQSGENERN